MSVPVLFYWWRTSQRPGAEMLAAGGIAVGVALVFGSLVASTSVTRSASQIVHGVVGHAELQLAARSPTGFDERIAGAVEKLQGVAQTGAVLRADVAILGSNGRDSAQLFGLGMGVTALGGSDARVLRKDALKITDGLLLPADIAQRIGARPGAMVTVLAGGIAHQIPVAGVLESSQSTGALAAGPVAITLLPLAQQLTGKTGQVSEVFLSVHPGARQLVLKELERLAAGRLDVLPAMHEVSLLEAAYAPSQQSTDLFSAIAMMIGFLLAWSAMLLTVPARRRLTGELRLSGYDDSQVLVILVFQALLLGIIGSLAGIGLGYVLSHTLFGGAPDYLAFAFPISSRQTITPTIILIAASCGLGAATLASLPPILDLRPGQPLDLVLREREESGQNIPNKVILAFAIGGLLMTVTAVLLALFDPRWSVLGGVILAVATACVIPAAYRLLLSSLSALSLNVKGMLGFAVIQLNATATGSIALAAVAALIVYGSVAIGGARADLNHGLESTIAEYQSTANIWVTTGDNVFDTDSFRASGLVAAIRRLPSVSNVRIYQGGLLDIGTRRLLVRAHDPGTPTMIQTSAIVHGNAARANQLLRVGGWATVSEGLASEQHLHVGERVNLPTPAGMLRLRIAAITTNLGWPPGLVTLSTPDYRQGWLTDEPSALEIDLQHGVSPSAGRRAVQGILVDYPGLQAHTSTESTIQADESVRQGSQTLQQISTLLLLTGACAIATSLCAAISQHRNRHAAMRTMGYTSHQLWRSLLLESMILLTVGCTIGTIIGLGGHIIATRYLRLHTGFPASFSPGVLEILITLLIVTAISLIAVGLRGINATRVSPTISFQE